MTTTEPAPTDFRIVTPQGWFDVELDADLAADRHEKLVRRRVGGDAASAELRRRLVARLDRFAADARAEGAVGAAMLAERLGTVTLSASLVLFVRAVGEDQRDPEVAAAQLAGGPGSVELVDLPAGRSVRHERTDDVVQDGQHLTVLTVEYLIPIPDSPRVLFLELSTPTTSLADPLRELFGKVAETVSWVR